MSMLLRLKQFAKEIRRRYSLWLYFLSGKEEYNDVNMQLLHDKYVGKRCFIICNGPSLKAEDLEKIHKNNDFSFASNKIDKIFPHTSWRPTFYSVIDESFQYSLLGTMNKIPAQTKFFRKESYITTRKVRGNCVWMNTDGDRSLLDNPRFSDNCAEVVYTIATVTYVLFELAVYMGFRELYIIGCDNSYGLEKKKDGTIVNHGTESYFAGSNPNDKKLIGATWEMNIAYEYARQFADEHGIKIYNATRGGHLEAFERVDFDSLF